LVAQTLPGNSIEQVRVMNLSLLQQRCGEWSYRSQDQMELSRFSSDVLHWDLQAFDCWVFDDRNWSMYTRNRQRLIALREDLSIAYAHVRDDRMVLEQLLLAHCISAYKTTRTSKIPQHPALAALERAYPYAKLRQKQMGRLSPLASAKFRREDEQTAQRLLMHLS
jgi:hypothetical protein